MKVQGTSFLKRLSVFLFASSLTCLFVVDLCGWIFQCGCRSLWAGADRYCNVHMAGVKHCPWCVGSGVGAAFSLLPVLLLQAVVSFAPGRWGIGPRLLLAVLAFPFCGVIAALILGGLQGYWR